MNPIGTFTIPSPPAPVTSRRGSRPRLSVKFAAEDALVVVHETYSRDEYDRRPAWQSRPSFLLGWRDEDGEEASTSESRPQVLSSPRPKRAFVRTTSFHDSAAREAQGSPQREEADRTPKDDTDSDEDDLGLDPWATSAEMDEYHFTGGEDSSRSTRGRSPRSDARLGNLSIGNWNPVNELEALFGPGVTEDDFLVDDDEKDTHDETPRKSSPPQWVQMFEHPCSDDEGDCTVPWINMDTIPGLVEDSEGYSSDESAGPSTPLDEVDAPLSASAAGENQIQKIEPLRLAPKDGHARPAGAPASPTKSTAPLYDATSTSIDILHDSELDRLQDELWKLFSDLSLDDPFQFDPDAEVDGQLSTATPSADKPLNKKEKYDGLGGGWPSTVRVPKPTRVFAQRHTIPLDPVSHDDDSSDMNDISTIFVLRDDVSQDFEDIADVAHSSPQQKYSSLPAREPPAPFLGVTQTMYCKENYSFATNPRTTASPRRRSSTLSLASS